MLKIIALLTLTFPFAAFSSLNTSVLELLKTIEGKTYELDCTYKDRPNGINKKESIELTVRNITDDSYDICLKKKGYAQQENCEWVTANPITAPDSGVTQELSETYFHIMNKSNASISKVYTKFQDSVRESAHHTNFKIGLLDNELDQFSIQHHDYEYRKGRRKNLYGNKEHDCKVIR